VSRKPRRPNKPLFDAIERGRPGLVRELIAEGMSVQDPCGKDGDTPLGSAMQRQDPEIVRALLEAGADPNKAHIPPILDAAHASRLDIVELLLDAGADVTVRGPHKETLMSVAVGMDNAALLQRIIDAGADVQATDPRGHTGLVWAARLGCWTSFEFLVPFFTEEVVEEARATPPVERSEWVAPTAAEVEAFANAVAAGDPEAIRALAARNMPLNEIDRTSGETPLLVAINAKGLATIELLLELGADPDHGGVQIPLSAAVVTGEVPIIEALLAAGAEIDQRDEDGCTALMDAAAAGNLEMVKLLVEAGADPNAVDDLDRTALDVAQECRKRKVAAYLGSTMQTGVAAAPKRPEPARGAGVAADEALLMAAMLGDLEGARAALVAGASVNARGAGGKTALATAAGDGNAGIAGLLIDAGADVNLADDSSNTPLTAAVQEGSLEMVELLLQHGANPSQAGRQGRTPLQLAAVWAHNVAIVKALIAVGADTEGLTSEEWERPAPRRSWRLSHVHAGSQHRRPGRARGYGVAEHTHATSWVCGKLAGGSALRPIRAGLRPCAWRICLHASRCGLARVRDRPRRWVSRAASVSSDGRCGVGVGRWRLAKVRPNVPALPLGAMSGGALVARVRPRGLRDPSRAERGGHVPLPVPVQP